MIMMPVTVVMIRSLVFGGCAFPPVSLGPAGDCPVEENQDLSMACPPGGAAAAGGAGASAAECAGVRSAAKLNCHLMLPVSVGARWGPDRSCHPRRAVLPSSAAEIREFLVFVHSGFGCTR